MAYLHNVTWKCLNPKCGFVFSALYPRPTEFPHWQWCPECRASSRLKSEYDTQEATAALAAKDDELRSEIAALRNRLASAEAALRWIQGVPSVAELLSDVPTDMREKARAHFAKWEDRGNG